MPTNHVRETQEALTAQVLAAMSENPTGWAKPWREILTHTPHNATTGKAYQGGNVLYLAMVQMAKGYPTTRWATYKQWEAVGAQVRKGETSTWCVKWTVVEDRRKGDGSQTLIPRPFNVFNEAQVDGAPPAPALPPGPDPIPHATAWFDAIGADVRHGIGGAYYSPGADLVNMPPLEAFTSAEGYYSTLGHEMVHWTGHRSRLNRHDGPHRFGSAEYAGEELVAELGAVFVAAHLGLDYESRLATDHAPYLAHWLQRAAQGDRTHVWKAATKAQAALDFLRRAAGEEATETTETTEATEAVSA